MRRSGTSGSLRVWQQFLSLPAGRCIAFTQHGKEKQDIVYTWSCCGATGCWAADAAGAIGADDCANPAGACITDFSFDQSFVYNLACGEHMHVCPWCTYHHILDLH